jgi:sulfite exporter TauE/SafE
MNILRTHLTLSAFVLMTLVISAIPAFAVEGAEESKSQLITRSQHHRVGAVILFVFSLLALMALVNAVQQLRGKRDQADGEFRWR